MSLICMAQLVCVFAFACYSVIFQCIGMSSCSSSTFLSLRGYTDRIPGYSKDSVCRISKRLGHPRDTNETFSCWANSLFAAYGFSKAVGQLVGCRMCTTLKFIRRNLHLITFTDWRISINLHFWLLRYKLNRQPLCTAGCYYSQLREC